MEDSEYLPPSIEDSGSLPPSMEGSGYLPHSMEGSGSLPPSMEDSGYLPPSMENSGFVHLLHPGLPGAKLLQDVDASGFLLKEHRLHQSFHLPADVGTRTRPLRLVRRNR